MLLVKFPYFLRSSTHSRNKYSILFILNNCQLKDINMNRTKILKYFVLLVSTIMFSYQCWAAIDKLIDPPIALTSEQIKVKDIEPPMITICPYNQTDDIKLKKFGYSSIFHLFYGTKQSHKLEDLSWGADLNITFDKILKESLNYSIDEAKIYVDEVVNGLVYFNRYSLEREYYPAIPGFCWNLKKYNISNILIIRTQTGKEKRFAAYITDRTMATHVSLDMKTHKGQLVLVESNYRYRYEVEIHRVSKFDPRNPDVCVNYENDEYYSCVDFEFQRYVKPFLGCNPPWLSKIDQCQGVIRKFNMTDKNFDIYASRLNPLIFNDKPDATRKCKPSCQVTESHVRLLESHALNPYSLELEIHESGTFTKKYVTYNFSSFLIDIGSSLGLWFGLSIFGLTDLGIDIFMMIKKLHPAQKSKLNSSAESESNLD